MNSCEVKGRVRLAGFATTTCVLSPCAISLSSQIRSNRTAHRNVAQANAPRSAWLIRLAWCGIPTRSVAEFLEMRAGDKRLKQILRIGDDGSDHQPSIVL